MKFYFLFIFTIISVFGISQTPSIGLLHTYTGASPGYTLFTPEQNSNVYLINNCGKLINQWEFSEMPGATCYLLENGNLLRAGRDSIEIRDWNSNLLWSYATTENGIDQHHDIHPMPNGNILCLVTDEYIAHNIVVEGRDPENTDDYFRLDKIIELEPIGINSAEIVWEWKFIDHLIQDFDESKNNFGIVENHPDLLDINFENGQNKDWTHVNAIEYNEELDQILITSRHLSEIYIIDHSTTIEEAASHQGGVSNKGGGFLWRWGNPQVYRQGSSVDQKLKWPHDAKWVKESYFDFGKISIYNNNSETEGNTSYVHLIEPEIENSSYLISNNTFLPEDYNWTWGGELFGETIYSSKKSGAHSLPNGNFLICDYVRSTIFEISKTGELLWAYRNPAGAEISEQFGTYDSSLIGIFRGEKYPPDYPGFDGKDLSPQGIIENENNISANCISVDISSQNTLQETILKENIITNNLLTFNDNLKPDMIKIIGLDGKTHLSQYSFNKDSIIINLKPGIYIIQVYSHKNIKSEKFIVQ